MGSTRHLYARAADSRWPTAGKVRHRRSEAIGSDTAPTDVHANERWHHQGHEPDGKLRLNGANELSKSSSSASVLAGLRFATAGANIAVCKRTRNHIPPAAAVRPFVGRVAVC